MTTLVIVQLVTVLITGLIAGLFYGYSCSVNGCLGNLSDEKYLEAFQSINRVIQNPVFFLSFMGSAILLPIVTVYTYRSGSHIAFQYLLAASIIYFIGVMGITIAANIPLNEQLDKFSLRTATAQEISAFRDSFENRWNSFHTIRTIASIITFVISILAIIKQKN